MSGLASSGSPWRAARSGLKIIADFRIRRRDAKTADAIAALGLLGSAMVDGSVDDEGTLQSPDFSPQFIKQTVKTAWRALEVSMWSEAVYVFKAVLILPFQALWVTPKTIAEVVDGSGKLPPARRYLLRYELHPELRYQSSLAEFGACLSANAANLIENPSHVASPAREVLISRVTGMPEDYGCSDGPYFPILINRIGERVEGPPEGEALWRWALGILSGLAILVIVGLLRVGTRPVSLALLPVLLALIGCGITGYVRERLVTGYDATSLPTMKTLIKIPTVLAVLAGACATVILRVATSPVFYLIAVAASLLLGASALVADLLFNHAESATKRS